MRRSRESFINILRNSIEAMSGGGKITVKLDIIDKFVEVNITDTGPGYLRR